MARQIQKLASYLHTLVVCHKFEFQDSKAAPFTQCPKPSSLQNFVSEPVRNCSEAQRIIQAFPQITQIAKGPTHMAVVREAAHFFVYEETIAKPLFRMMKNYSKPIDELFFQTLNYNPAVNLPGGANFLGNQKTKAIMRHKEWVWSNVSKCASGNVTRDLCMMGVNHLWKLTNWSYGRFLFVNKFLWDFQPFAWNCMLTWHWDKVRHEYKTGQVSRDFDADQMLHLSHI